jgi:selenocysteine lyase/cysteine desulfurase
VRRMPTEARLAALAAGLGSAAAGACLGRCLAASPAAAAAAAAADADADAADASVASESNALAPLSDFLLEPGLCYLNTGTLGPLPRCVVSAVSAELEWLAANPLNNYFGGGDDVPATERMDAVRGKVADFLGCDVAELCLVPSTTVALNTVASGLVDSDYLRANHSVLQTDQEHPGGEACWRHLEALGQLAAIDRLELPPVPASADEIVALFAAAMRPTTRVICISHVLTTSGTVLPLQRLAELAHANDALLLVDGAQAPGSLAVTLDDTGADVYTVSAHKWMLAPPGSGLVYIRRAAQEHVQAAFFDADTPPPVDAPAYGGDPSRYLSYTHSSGTTPTHTIAGLGAAVGYLDSLGGKAAVQANNIALRDRVYTGLAELSRGEGGGGGGLLLRLLSPPPGSDLCSSIVSFSIPTELMSAVRQLLALSSCPCKC